MAGVSVRMSMCLCVCLSLWACACVLVCARAYACVNVLLQMFCVSPLELECHMHLALQFGTPVPTAKSTQPALNLFTGVDRCCLPTGTWHSSSTVTRKVGTPVPTKRKNGHSSSMHATNLAVQFHGCKNPRPTISAAVVTCTCM